jgi:hypothetical protein
MKLVPANGNAFIGNTPRGKIMLYEWHNSWLLARHIHYNKFYQQLLEIEPIDIDERDENEREVVIAGNQKSEY